MGAEVCGACHAEIFTAQSQSNHAKALRPISGPKSITSPPTGKGKESSDPRAAHYTFQKKGSRYGVIVNVGTQKTEIPIQWVFGAGDQGQTLFSQLQNGKFLEHRLSYYQRKNGFDLTVGHHPRRSRTLEQAMGRLVSPDEASQCFGCHSTYVNPTSDGPDFRSVVPAITCERCHGPGEDHVEAITSGASNIRILNPGKLGGEELVRLCGQCHRTEPAPLGISVEHPIVTRFQPVGLLLSACFQKSAGAINCLTCHNPHENVRRGDDDYYNGRCLTCHTEETATRCPVNSSKDCIRCHMPKTTPLPYVVFSDHWIRVPKSPASRAP